ncbi:MAG TPA: 16S rRNA (guanine(527)-N(7))-methyltransferase RsmG [Dissulfurispiraceae bacterium]|nr:16S rRNA (guanine(527)-N(7))-methyltransferase RsmG [Dissulfurispiraceae bacterium]
MDAEKELLIQGLSVLDIVAPPETVEAFLFYLSELKKWNKAYNLTAITAAREIIIKHFLDSLLYLKALPPSVRTVCDVGSGAGFPGVPLSLASPDSSVTLIEPSRKRCAFLRHITHRLALERIAVIEARVDELNGPLFDAVVTRATFSVADFVKQAGHLVDENGCLVMNKGGKAFQEISALPAGYAYESIPATLPFAGQERVLLRLTRTYHEYMG